MSTHNICFCREIRKILCVYPLISIAMVERLLCDWEVAGSISSRVIPKTLKK